MEMHMRLYEGQCLNIAHMEHCYSGSCMEDS